MYIKLIIRFIFILAVFTLSINPAISQVHIDKSNNKVLIEGKVYFIHMVKPGQTIYSISAAYNIPIAEIVTENPGADKILSPGQALKIPEVSQSARTKVPEVVKPGYLNHKVIEKETLYSISKVYNISVMDIQKANPDLVNNNLTIGQILYIPNTSNALPQQNFSYHKVKRKETLYGICKKYKISEDVLKFYNPELKNSHPYPGQILIIPDVTKSKDLSASIKGKQSDTIKLKTMPYDTVTTYTTYNYFLDSLPELSGRSFNVAYLIPFNFSPREDSLSQPDENYRGIIKNIQKGIDEILPESQNFLEFMEGSLLAIDQLSQNGLSVNVFIYDTRRSPDRVREIINSKDFDKMDLIIGPFYSFNVEIASEFALEHRIPIISPFFSGDKLTLQNPYLFQVNPSYRTEFDQYAKYIASFPDKNIILIHGKYDQGYDDSIKIDYLRSKISENYASKGFMDSLMIKNINFRHQDKSVFINEIQSSLSNTQENLVIIPVTNEVDMPLSTVISQLYYLQRNYKIKVIGMPSWTTFQSIDYSYYHNLEVSYLTPYYFSYDSIKIKKFLKKYTAKYFAEPDNFTKKGCSYAFMGYDLSYYFLSSIKKYGRRFIMHLDENSSSQLLNDFHFERVNNYGGFENRSLMLVKLMPDMNIRAKKFYPSPK